MRDLLLKRFVELIIQNRGMRAMKISNERFRGDQARINRLLAIIIANVFNRMSLRLAFDNKVPEMLICDYFVILFCFFLILKQSIVFLRI